uniref:IgGFc_binding domain-containing protein n=1 Tax=Panagrellus redivivus TaxID=6233 RepID=A0A7E4ZXL6_PANRE
MSHAPLREVKTCKIPELTIDICKDIYADSTSTPSYVNNITIVPPFTLYDLSTIQKGLLSFYTNDSSYDILSPVISNGLTSYSANSSSLYVQYFFPETDYTIKSNSFVRYLVGPSDMFTNVGCSIPSVVTIAQNAALVLNLEAQSGKCIFRILHNATEINNASLTFSFDQLRDRAGVEIFSGDGGKQSVKLDHVPQYLFGEMVTVQYSGSPGSITVRSVPPSNIIVLPSNCTPTYALMPGFNENAIKDDYFYYISALNTEKNWTFHLTTLSFMDKDSGFSIEVLGGNKPSFYSIDAADIKINETLIFYGTGLYINADNTAVRRLYFSVAICEDKPGSAIGKACHVLLLFMAVCRALWNHYGFAL